ncbi:Hypothetical Protein FCC1311_093282 [Hondaea fermentalgiana]|uniref:Uncharacterized protein n=1 Tax=Hondaea fermentalgiana TaxID=2315210 RepID=A0A2R5GYN6_9STRA|nr:Hypothetical Protein FCC1311_093282 [Hondaea fermentalgiana]|eukprot:GBG33104.1 Hypothetical Protein FCC1311_093282 [Hondaea fermentalgiana]
MATTLAREVAAVRRARESLEGVDVALQALTDQLRDLESAYGRMEQANRGWAQAIGKPLPENVEGGESRRKRPGRPPRSSA